MKEIDIYNRIISILYRILILTLMYEIVIIFFIIVFIFTLFFLPKESSITYVLLIMMGGLSSISLCYSMFLMQQHNDYEYKKFLKILHNFYLHYICCCCKSIIIYELELDLVKQIKNQQSVNANSNNVTGDKNTTKEDTLDETNDASPKNIDTNINPYELSIQTATVYNKLYQTLEK